MSMTTAAVFELKRRLWRLAPARRNVLLPQLTAAEAMPEGHGRSVALAKVSRRILRAEALDSNPRRTRA